MPSVNDEFLEAYDDAITEGLRDYTLKEDQAHTESALCKLLKRYSDEIPDISDERFHKTFRQVDAVDNDAPDEKGGLIDMAIWNLLYPCNLFWKVREKFFTKEPADGSS